MQRQENADAILGRHAGRDKGQSQELAPRLQVEAPRRSGRQPQQESQLRLEGSDIEGPGLIEQRLDRSPVGARKRWAAAGERRSRLEPCANLPAAGVLRMEVESRLVRRGEIAPAEKRDGKERTLACALDQRLEMDVGKGRASVAREGQVDVGVLEGEQLVDAPMIQWPLRRRRQHGAAMARTGAREAVAPFENGLARLAAAPDERVHDPRRRVGDRRELPGHDCGRHIIDNGQETQGERFERLDRGAITARRGGEKIGMNAQEHRADIEILVSTERGKARQIGPFRTRHTQLFTCRAISIVRLAPRH